MPLVLAGLRRSVIQHKYIAGFARTGGVRFAYPAVGDGGELAVHIHQRQARALPRRNARLLQQLLELMPVRVPRQTASLAPAPQPHA